MIRSYQNQNVSLLLLSFHSAILLYLCINITIYISALIAKHECVNRCKSPTGDVLMF